MTSESSNLWENRRVQGAAVLVLLLLAVFLFAQTIKAFKEYRFVGSGVPSSNVISVTGEGEVFAVPDIAVFTFSVIEEATTAPEAQAQATERINQALAFVREQGIEEKDIKTVAFNLSPQYDYQEIRCITVPCPPTRPVLRGFQVNQTIEIKLRDTAKSGEFVSGLANLGVQNVNGPNFTVDDDEAVREEARELAITDARAKAEKLAEQLGVELVRIVNFSENGMGGPILYQAKGMDMDRAESAAAVPAPEIPVGENQTVSNVTISYEIR